MEHCSHDVAAFRCWPWREVKQVVQLLIEADQRVADGTMTAAKREQLKMVTGLNTNPMGLLASRRLSEAMDPIEACTYDWVHNILQDGVFSVELQAFLEAADITKKTLQAMLSTPRM